MIKSCYKNLECFGLPYPGEYVENDDFRCDMLDISDEVKNSV